MPIRLRLTLFGGIVVALTVVAFGLLVYVFVQRNLVTNQDTVLRQRLQSGALSRGDRRSVIGPGGGPTRAEVTVDLRTSSDTFVEVLLPSGAPVFSNGEIDGHAPTVDPGVLNQVPASDGLLTTIDAAGNVPVRVAVRRASPNDPTGAGYYLVGQALGPVAGQLAELRLVLIGAAVLSLIGALLASWVVAGRALRPVDRIAETAEEIGRTRDLSRRLPVSGTNDEVSRLSGRFNDMLSQLQDAYGRLEDALAAQQRFVADASHELRTPLTTITSNVGLLLKQRNVRAEDQRDALEDISAESDRMTRLVQELLTLARADAGQHLEMAPVDLATIASDVCRQAGRLNADRRVAYSGKSTLPLQGNEDALRQLLWILVDNGIKHTVDGGRVDVSISHLDERAVLAVRDDGGGIPEADLERIFERFYRPDAARSGDGAGLGLAIARWIVEEHGGRVVAVNNTGGSGATFTVELPATAVEGEVSSAA
jgi:two-component system OmpR family sensor kinase